MPQCFVDGFRLSRSFCSSPKEDAVTYAQSGCATWKPVRRDSIEKILDQRKPTRVRVGAAGSVMELREPAIVGDTLVGRRINLQVPRRVAIPLSRVDSVAMLQSGRPPKPVVGGILMAFWITVILVVQGPPPKPDI